MDPDRPKSTPRKVKFAPKAPPRRTPKAVATTTESVGEDASDEEAQQRFLTRKVTENLTRKGSKPEKKSTVQVAFQQGASSSTEGIRTFGRRKESLDDRSNVAKSEEVILHDSQSLVASSPSGSSDDDSDDSTDDPTVEKKAYKEPWDYENSYYPTVLPLRRPYSGDPELLDKKEFDEPEEYDENTLNSAKELGFLDECEDSRMFLFQFPTKLPFGTKPTGTTAEEMKAKGRGKAATCKGKEIASDIPKKQGKKVSGSSMSPSTGQSSAEDSIWDELPEGHMGKMLVYKSGEIKLKLGEVLFNVDPGIKCEFQCGAAAIDPSNGHLCDLGKMEDMHVVVTPDIDFLMNNDK